MNIRNFVTLLVMIGTITTAQAEVKFAFGVYASDKPSTMVTMFKPILVSIESRLSEKLGEPVKISLQVASTYKEGIEDLVNGRVDFARMGPASYIISKERNADLKLLAMESIKGKKVFYGIICVPEQSPINSITQLKGKKFAFGNERSTIGRYLSQHMLVKQGVRAKDLSDYKYLQRHDRVGFSVGSGQFDAGALKEGTFKKLKNKGVKIRELARFPNVTKPWIASSKMNKRLFATLQQVLLEFNDKAALKKLKKQGFLPASNSDYNSIRLSMKQNNKFFQK